MKNLPQRKKIRLQGYDYSQDGAYFITICTKNRAEIFCHIENGNAILNKYGKIVKDEIEKIPQIRKECVIDCYVVMPNHVHIIACLVGDDGNRPAPTVNYPKNASATMGGLPSAHTAHILSNMVKGFKGAVSRRFGFSPWQRSFHDRIIRNDNEYRLIAEYIENNPMQWENDCFYVQPVGDDGNRPANNGNHSANDSNCHQTAKG
jgi:REP element-mobilizing transposase RayT